MSTNVADAQVRDGVHRLFWRVHFWAGLITAPLVFFAAASGLLYAYTPQIEAILYADLDTVVARGPARTLDAQVQEAQAAFADRVPRMVVPASRPGATTQVVFSAPGAGLARHDMHAMHEGRAPPDAAQPGSRAQQPPGQLQGWIAYVDPSTARVVGSIAERDRFRNWARKLHSSFLQGDGWRWPIELAASWLLLMLATGITLWWPRGRVWAALRPQRLPGRAGWRSWHTVIGVWMSLLLGVVVVTGLTWSKQAGGNFRALQQALHQQAPKPPRQLALSLADAPRASMQQVWDAARAAAAQAGVDDVPLQLTLPPSAADAWRVDTQPQRDPTERLALVIDPVTARVLYRSGWHDLPLLAQATAIGIPFHRAELGVWNQCLIVAAALAAMAAVVSGVVMWWRRRPAGRVAAPPVGARHLRAVPLLLWPFTAALAWAMPVFGVSLAGFVLLELLAAAWQRQVRRAD